MHANWLGAIMPRPFWWAPASIRCDALATIDALNGRAHRNAARVTRPLRGTGALHCTLRVGAVSTVTACYICNAIIVQHATGFVIVSENVQKGKHQPEYRGVPKFWPL